MAKGRALLVGAFTALIVLATVACEQRSEPRPGPAPVRLGALLPLSGRSSPSGTAMLAAAKMAVADANDAGGVLGREVELIVGDDACDPGTAVGAANQLVTRDIVVSVGGYCSSATAPTLKAFRTSGIPMIIPASNSTDLLVPEYDSVFLLSGTVTAEATFALDHIRQFGGHRLAVVHDGTSFPSALAAAATAAATGNGLTGAGSLTLSQGAPSFARIAQAVLDSGADTVFYTGYYAEAQQLVVDLRASGFRGTIFLGDGAVVDQLLGGLTEAQAVDLYGASLPVPEFMPGLSDWISRYRSVTGSAPGPSTLEAYDAVRLAVDAIRRAGTTDRQAVRAAIAASLVPDMISGSVRFNPDGTRHEPVFLLMRATGGRFVLAPDQG
jgi:branched-chain amino acid transport system substrate-binding protein